MMNRTEKFVRQYLRSSCDPNSSLPPDLKLVCSNGPSYAHKFALLSVLPDLGRLFCSPCLTGHDPITLLLPDFTREVVNEARDFFYMYGEVGSLAKIFGMKKVKENINFPLTTDSHSKIEGQKLSINKAVFVPEIKPVNTMSENIVKSCQPPINSGDDISDHLRKAMSEYAERQKISVAAYPGIDFQKVKNRSKIEQKNVTGTHRSKQSVSRKQIGVSKSKAEKHGKKKLLQRGEDEEKLTQTKEALDGKKTVDMKDSNRSVSDTSSAISDKLVFSGNEEVEIEEYIEYVTDGKKNPENISEELFKQVDSLLLEAKILEEAENQVREAPLIIKEMDFNKVDEKYNNGNVSTEVPNDMTNKPYSCENCEFSTKYKTVLKEHQRREKENNQPQSYSCDSTECKFVTKNRGNLIRHIAKVHDSLFGGKFICSGCNFLTTDEESLRNHIREEHSGHKFKCQKCDYSNESKYWVNNHFAIIHEGVRYPCDYCEFLSKSRGELTKHNRKFHG